MKQIIMTTLLFVFLFTAPCNRLFSQENITILPVKEIEFRNIIHEFGSMKTEIEGEISNSNILRMAHVDTAAETKELYLKKQFLDDLKSQIKLLETGVDPSKKTQIGKITPDICRWLKIDSSRYLELIHIYGLMQSLNIKGREIIITSDMKEALRLYGGKEGQIAVDKLEKGFNTISFNLLNKTMATTIDAYRAIINDSIANIDGVLKGISDQIKESLVLNKNSSLQREWITINEKPLLAVFHGSTEIKSIYKEDPSGIEGYQYESRYGIDVMEPLSAIEIRFIIFDIWGKPIRNLSSIHVKDIPIGSNHIFSSNWKIFSNNEAREFKTSISYISRVVTKSGRVIEAERTQVLSEAQKINKQFSLSDLDRKIDKN